MNWRPLLTPVERMKLCLYCAPTREAAKRQFDALVSTDPGDDELELVSFYYSSALHRLGSAP
jgi:hypothetical protein